MTILEKITKTTDDVINFILGENRSGEDRRVKKLKKKVTRRKSIRRK